MRIQTVFWQGVILIVRLRLELALRSCARSTATLFSLAFVLLAGGPASFAAASICHSRLQSAGPPAAPRELSAILLAVQAICIVALLPRLGVALGRSLAPTLLHPFPVRPVQVIVANAIGAILDTPILFALPVFAVVVRWSFERHGVIAALATCLILVLLTLQTTALYQAMEQAGRWVVASRRGGILVAAALVALAGSVLWPPGPGLGAASQLQTRVSARSSGPTFWTAALPGGLAARAIVAAQQSDWVVVAAEVLVLAALIPATLWCAARIYCICDTYDSAARSLPPRRKPRPLSPGFASPQLSQIAAVFGLEWRCLLRDPSAYLPLRGPAMLLLVLFLTWIAPDRGSDPILTLRDLVSMSALFYVVLCQIQLLCNRFGNERGTAGLLFAFPAPRKYILAGKNAALIGLLLPLDATIVLSLCTLAHAPIHLVGSILAANSVVLIVATALGNLVSVLAPFPIAKRGERFQYEPDRSLGLLYCLVGCAAGCACWAYSDVQAKSFGAVAAILTPVALLGLYVSSVLIAERMLTRRELRMIRALEGETQ